MSTDNIATMTADELEDHIERVIEKHRMLIRSLRALARARHAEQDAAWQQRQGERNDRPN
jgi:hypothetical protein